MRKGIGAACILLISIGLILGGSLLGLAQGEKYGGTLIELVREEPDNLSPQVTTRAVSYIIFDQIVETLLVWNFDLELEGWLADSWEVSQNQLTWTFELKKGITFHDGEPFNAKAVEYTFGEDTFFACPSAWELEPVKEVKAVGEYTVEFKLKEPFPTLPEWLADGYTSILPPGAAEYGDRFGTDILIGTGPYRLEKWEHGVEIVLVSNEDYRHGPAFLENKGPAYIEKKIFRVVPEDTTRVQEVLVGAGDLTPHLPPTFVPQAKASPDVQVVITPAYGVQYMVANMDNEIVQDIWVRKAIAYGIDKEAILKAAWSGIGWPADGLFPATTTGYWPGVKEVAYQYDPEEAEELLAEAGWVDTDGDGIRDKDGKKLELDLITFTLEQWSKAAQIIKAQLAEVGIKINAEILEVGATYDKAEAGEFDLGIFKILYNLGSGYINFLAGAANIPTSNFSRYIDPVLDEAINGSMTTPDPALRQVALNKAQRIVIESAVWVPLVIRTDRMVVKNSVGGTDEILKHPWWGDSGITQALLLYKK